MPTPSTADRLLDAQVEFVLAELRGDRFAALVGSVVDDLLEIAATLTLEEVVDAGAVKAALRSAVQTAAQSPLVAEAGESIAGALYDLPAAEDHLLGDVVHRDDVSTLVSTLLAMRQLQDRALERLTESPQVATLVTTFVARIVGDVLAQNRARAEKVPGVSSLFSLGTSAASRVKSVGDQLLGDMGGKGAAFTLRRTNSTIRDLIHDEHLHGAAMELWDLHAKEPVADLRTYLTRDELVELVAAIHPLVTGAAQSEFVGLALDAGVDTFFADYGGADLATLLEDLGVQRDDLVTHVTAVAAPVLAAAEDELRPRIRARLEPFFRSPDVAEILG